MGHTGAQGWGGLRWDAEVACWSAEMEVFGVVGAWLAHQR